MKVYLKFINTKMKNIEHNFLFPNKNKIDLEFVFGLILSKPTNDEISQYFSKEKKSNINFDFETFENKIRFTIESNQLESKYYIYSIILKCTGKCFFDTSDEIEEFLDSAYPELYKRFCSSNHNILDLAYSRIMEKEENIYHTTDVPNDIIVKYLDIILTEKGH